MNEPKLNPLVGQHQPPLRTHILELILHSGQLAYGIGHDFNFGALPKAQLIVAVRMGGLAEVRHLVECAGTDVNTRDRVSCGFIHHDT